MKKIFKYILISCIVLFLFTIIPIFFYRIEINNKPLSPNYKKGVYHVHSNFSDGTGTIEEIALAASRCNLDFVIVNDHGRPNRRATQATAWIHGVLLVGASEFSLNCGHLTAMGYTPQQTLFPTEPQESINDLNQQGASSFIAHPTDKKTPWTDWNVHSFSGIEIISLYSCVLRAGIFRALLFPSRYLFDSNDAALNLIYQPVEEYKKWDELNKTGRCYGIFALDAHAKFPISKKLFYKFPSYSSLFRILTVYVKIDRELTQDANESARIVLAAIHKGNFFNTIEAIGPANGFDYFFRPPDQSVAEMGSDSPQTHGSLIVRTPFLFETRVLVRKNGRVFREFNANFKAELNVPVDEAGVFRCEVYASGNRYGKLPWITSNPVFIGVPPDNKINRPPPPVIKKSLPLRQDLFLVEKNDRSVADISLVEPVSGPKALRFNFHLQKTPAQRDFWAAMARRTPIDLSPYAGVVLQIRGDQSRRCWFELRTLSKGVEKGYYHSLAMDADWRLIYLSFAEFYTHSGLKKTPDLSATQAFFISINSFLADREISGWWEIKELAFY